MNLVLTGQSLQFHQKIIFDSIFTKRTLKSFHWVTFVDPWAISSSMIMSLPCTFTKMPSCNMSKQVNICPTFFIKTASFINLTAIKLQMFNYLSKYLLQTDRFITKCLQRLREGSLPGQQIIQLCYFWLLQSWNVCNMQRGRIWWSNQIHLAGSSDNVCLDPIEIIIKY